MESYTFLLHIALILLSTKLLGLFSRKLKMPQVVGALLAGLILGPALLGILHETDFLRNFAELGVIILMFTAGLETDVVELKKAGKASFIIALIGVLVPLAGGAAVAYLFSGDNALQAGGSTLLQDAFVGVIITATSVSITVETLREMGKLDTRAGSAILGAALIDDILGIIALTVITSFADSSVNILSVLVKIILFFGFLAIAGYLFFHLFKWLAARYQRDMRRFAILAFVFCLIMSYTAERYFGIADITGAYFAGLIICNTQKTKYIASRFETLSFLLFSPIFFANIGLEVELPAMTGKIVLFTIALLFIAILSKFIGCGLGAKLCGYSGDEAAQIGAGMAARGEVALIVASKGNALGLMNSSYYGSIIIMVMATAVIAPVLLKFTLSRQTAKEKYSDLVESPLVDRYRETEQFDLAQQALLNMHENYRKPGGKPPKGKSPETNKEMPPQESPKKQP